jgi:hypothetical protein
MESPFNGRRSATNGWGSLVTAAEPTEEIIMWGKVLLVLMGVSALWGAGTAIFRRRPITVIRSQPMSDGTIVKTEEFRTLRLWERLLFSLFGPAGVWMCVIAVVPDSRLAELTTAVVFRFYILVITVGVSAALVGSGGWLMYRRVLRRMPASRSMRASSPAVQGAAMSVAPSKVFDLVDEAAEGVVVRMNLARLLRALASYRGSAFVLAAIAGIFGSYLFTLVPAVTVGDYEQVAAIFVHLWLAAALAEVMVCIVLPALMAIALIVTVAKRNWNDAAELGLGVAVMAVGYTLAWRAGALAPLFELLRKLPVSIQL